MKLPPKLRQKGKAYYYDHGGKPRKWERLGSVYATALIKWADIHKGRDAELRTVGSLVDLFISKKQTLAESTLRSYRLYKRVLDKVNASPAPMLALDQGHLHAYICDFPKNGLKDHPRVVTLPHLGASTHEAEENCAVMVADTLRDYLENGNIRNSVNFPEAVLPRIPGTSRFAVANSNVPNMVGQISTCLADAKLNIAELLNKSRGEYAYTLIDAEGAVDTGLLGRIRAIEGVLSARLL